MRFQRSNQKLNEPDFTRATRMADVTCLFQLTPDSSPDEAITRAAQVRVSRLTYSSFKGRAFTSGSAVPRERIE